MPRRLAIEKSKVYVALTHPNTTPLTQAVVLCVWLMMAVKIVCPGVSAEIMKVLALFALLCHCCNTAVSLLCHWLCSHCCNTAASHCCTIGCVHIYVSLLFHIAVLTLLFHIAVPLAVFTLLYHCCALSV